MHLALFLALSLSPSNSLVSLWCDHSQEGRSHHRHTSIFCIALCLANCYKQKRLLTRNAFKVFGDRAPPAPAPRRGGDDSVSRYPLAGFTGAASGKEGQEKDERGRERRDHPPSTDFLIRHCRPMLLQRYSCRPACVSSVSLNHTPQSYDSPVSSIITLSITVCH